MENCQIQCFMTSFSYLLIITEMMGKENKKQFNKSNRDTP